MTWLSVGGYYGEPRRWPDGYVVTRLAAEQCEVLVSYSNLTDDEVNQWRETPITLWLSRVGALLILSFSDGLGGGDAPFHMQASDPAARTPLSDNLRPLVQFIVIEAESGRIRALRATNMSKEMAGLIGEATRAQLADPFSPAGYQSMVDRYLDIPAAVLKQRAVLTEVLGAAEPPAHEQLRDAQSLLAELKQRFPELHPYAAEVLAETISSGVGRIELRSGEAWYVDPEFGGDTPVAKLGYDNALGLVDRRQFPEAGQA